MTDESAREDANQSIEFWRSDEGYTYRCGQYLAHMLWADERNRRCEYSSVEGPAPEWPAIFFYDPILDMPFWLECQHRTHLRDYAKACRKMDINAAGWAIIDSWRNDDVSDDEFTIGFNENAAKRIRESEEKEFFDLLKAAALPPSGTMTKKIKQRKIRGE
jgi:hypothetical protein